MGKRGNNRKENACTLLIEQTITEGKNKKETWQPSHVSEAAREKEKRAWLTSSRPRTEMKARMLRSRETPKKVWGEMYRCRWRVN